MNRNRNHRQRSKPVRKTERQTDFAKQFKSAVFQNNLAVEAAKFLGEAFKTPLQAVGGVVAFLGSLVSIVDFFIKDNERSSSDGILSVFSARVLAFLIIAASLGWTISLIGIWLTKNINDTRTMIAHIITAFGAIFMAACIESIFRDDIKHAHFLVLMFAIIGVTFAIFLAKTNFRQTYDSNPEVTAARAALLLNFAGVAAALIVFSQLTGLMGRG